MSQQFPNQQQPWQQPPSGYQQSQYQQQPEYAPPMQSGMYPPPQPPKKKSRKGLWIGLGVLVVILVLCSVVSLTVSRGAATSTASVATGTTSDATSAPGSQHFKIGQVVNVGDTWTITVMSAKTSTGSEFNKPQKAGNVFLILQVTAKNRSAQQQTVSSLIQFALTDASGQKYDQTIDPDAGASLDGNVGPDSQIKGALAWEVPANVHDYQLAFQSDLSSDQVYWDIHV